MSSNRFYVPDLRKLNIKGCEYDSSAIIGNYYDEFRSARRHFCGTKEFKTFKESFEEKTRALSELRKAYSSVSNETSPESMVKLAETRVSKDRRTVLLKYDDQDYRKKRKVLMASVNSLKVQLREAKKNQSPQTPRLKARLSSEAEVLDRLIREHSEKKLQHLVAIEGYAKTISELENKKVQLLHQYSDAINQLETEIDAMKVNFRATRNDTLKNHYHAANEAIALIEADPQMHEETVNRLRELFPNYRKSRWEFDVSDETGSKATSHALISSIIKEHPHMTMADLIAQVSLWRQTSFVDSMTTILSLRDKKELYYYRQNRDGSLSLIPWGNAS